VLISVAPGLRDAYLDGVPTIVTRVVSANALAAATEIVSGKPCTVLCVWCLHAVDPHEERVAKRVGGTGFCVRCPYTDGPELFVVAVSTADACAIDVAVAA
jgi:hypothetical protein